MRCPSCQQEIGDAAFCKWCGTHLAPSQSQPGFPATRPVHGGHGVSPGGGGAGGGLAQHASGNGLSAPPMPPMAAEALPPTAHQPGQQAYPGQQHPGQQPAGGWQPTAPGAPVPGAPRPAPRSHVTPTGPAPTLGGAPQPPPRGPGFFARLKETVFGWPKPLLLGIGIGAPVLIGGVVVLLLLLLSGSDQGAIPLDPHKLPPNTVSVSTRQITSAEMPDPQVRALSKAAALGQLLCDPEQGNPWYAFRFSSMASIAEKLEDERRKKLAEMLRCGAQMSSQLESDLAGRIAFKYDDKRHRISFLSMSSVVLTAKGWLKHTFAGLPGHCWGGKKEECTDKSSSMVVHDGLLYWGRRASLEQLARQLVKPSEELTSGVEALAIAASHVTGLTERVLTANPKSLKSALMGFCRFGRSLSSWQLKKDICFPDGLDKRLEVYDSLLRAASFDQPATMVGAEQMRLGLTLVARDAEAAERLAKGLREFMRDWRAHIANNEGKFNKTVAKEPKTQREKLYKALVSAYLRGMNRIEVESDGRSVYLTIEEDLTEAERREAREAVVEAKEDRQIAAVLMAIRDGKAPPTKIIAKMTEKAVKRSMEKVARAAKRQFDRTRYRGRRYSYRLRRYVRTKPRAFPVAPADDGWLTGEALLEASNTWLPLVRPKDLALYKWRYRSSGVGAESTFTLEARLNHGDGTHTTYRITGKVDEALQVITDEVELVEGKAAGKKA